MAIMATAVESGKTFEPAPTGVHQAVCVDVIDLGWLKETHEGVESTKHKISVAWQIEELRDDNKPFLVFKRYTLSLNEKSNLSKDMEGWRGKRFTDEERRGGWDVESIVGKNCLLNITHNVARNGKTYANVASIMPLAKNMKPITAEGYVRKAERPVDNGSRASMVEDYDEQNPPPITDDDIPF